MVCHAATCCSILFRTYQRCHSNCKRIPQLANVSVDPTFATLRASVVRIIFSSIPSTGYQYYVAWLVRTKLVNHEKPTHSSARSTCTSTAWRSHIWRRAVPCLAWRYGAVPSSNWPYFVHTVPSIMRTTSYQVRVCTCVFVPLICLDLFYHTAPPPKQRLPLSTFYGCSTREKIL